MAGLEPPDVDWATCLPGPKHRNFPLTAEINQKPGNLYSEMRSVCLCVPWCMCLFVEWLGRLDLGFCVCVQNIQILVWEESVFVCWFVIDWSEQEPDGDLLTVQLGHGLKLRLLWETCCHIGVIKTHSVTVRSWVYFHSTHTWWWTNQQVRGRSQHISSPGFRLNFSLMKPYELVSEAIKRSLEPFMKDSQSSP